MVRLVALVVLVPFVAVADDAPWTFSAGITTAFLHQQQYVTQTLNDQESERITQSSQAMRLEVEYRGFENAGLLTTFVLPTRDETVRVGETIVDRYHYPKSLGFAAFWIAPKVPLTAKGWLEASFSAGVDVGLSSNFSEHVLPAAGVILRFALASGSALQLGVRYAGVGSRGSWTSLFGVVQRI